MYYFVPVKEGGCRSDSILASPTVLEQRLPSREALCWAETARPQHLCCAQPASGAAGKSVPSAETLLRT